ncbi:MAG: hypothetical protein PHI63_06030 [Patescibacteria group bacterium]|nr:hypothetical protein [Patescibacteria group bacterium]
MDSWEEERELMGGGERGASRGLPFGLGGGLGDLMSLLEIPSVDIRKTDIGIRKDGKLIRRSVGITTETKKLGDIPDLEPDVKAACDAFAAAVREIEDKGQESSDLFETAGQEEVENAEARDALLEAIWRVLPDDCSCYFSEPDLKLAEEKGQFLVRRGSGSPVTTLAPEVGASLFERQAAIDAAASKISDARKKASRLEREATGLERMLETKRQRVSRLFKEKVVPKLRGDGMLTTELNLNEAREPVVVIKRRIDEEGDPTPEERGRIRAMVEEMAARGGADRLPPALRQFLTLDAPPAMPQIGSGGAPAAPPTA